MLLGRASDGAGVVGDSVAFTDCRLAPLCLTPVLAAAVLLGVFRAAATESSPRRDKDRGAGKSRLAHPRLER